jgi:hypothetical protein
MRPSGSAFSLFFFADFCQRFSTQSMTLIEKKKSQIDRCEKKKKKKEKRKNKKMLRTTLFLGLLCFCIAQLNQVQVCLF